MIFISGSSDGLGRPGAQFHLVLEAENLHGVVDEPRDGLDLRVQLFRGAKDVGIVLGELAGPEEAVEDPRLLVPVHRAQLEIPEREIPVAADLRLVNEHVGDAVHGLDPVELLVHLGKIHVFPVVIEMARPLPEIALQDLGSLDDVVSPLQVFLSFPVLDNGPEKGALGMEDNEAGTDFVVHLEKVQFPPQAPVIPFLRLLDSGQVVVHS